MNLYALVRLARGAGRSRVTWITLAFLALGVLRFLFGSGVLR